MSENIGYTLITGASGFIGQALAAGLSQTRPVVCLSRHRPDNQANTRVPFVAGRFDVEDELQRLNDFPIDHVVHLAAVTGGCSEEDGLAVNVQGTRRLLRNLQNRGCRKFVLASSIAATGCLDQRLCHSNCRFPTNIPASLAMPMAFRKR